MRPFTRSTAVRPLYKRSNCLVARNGRKASQVDRLLDAHRLAIDLACIADGGHGTGEALVHRRAAVFRCYTLRLMAYIGHGAAHRRRADLVVAIRCRPRGFLTDPRTRFV